MAKEKIVLRLICRTTYSDVVDSRDALLELTAEDICDLFRYRDVFENAFAQVSLYCLEAFDRRCRFGTFRDKEEEYGELLSSTDAEWVEVTAKAGVELSFAEENCDLRTLKVTDMGVLWSAVPRHQDAAYFETVELSWAMLDACVRKMDR